MGEYPNSSVKIVNYQVLASNNQIIQFKAEYQRYDLKIGTNVYTPI